MAQKKRPGAPNTDELLNSAFASRKLDRELQVCETARQVLTLCRYNRAESHLWYAVPSARHAVFGMRRKKTSMIQVWLASPMRWLDDVDKRGLSLMSGCFVFEVVKQQPDGSLVVIAGRQGRGCSVNLAYALARPSGSSWVLQWKGLPEEFRVELPRLTARVADMIEAEGEYYHQSSMRRAVDLLDVMYGHKPATEK
jgi:hypothetical protein